MKLKLSNKKVIVFSAAFIIISLISIIYIYNLYKPLYIQLENLDAYCIQNSSINTESFLIKQEGNYYFCVSKDGDPKISPELFIFKKENNSNKKISYYEHIKGGKTRRNSYSMYKSNFPDENNRYTGNSMIFFSDNNQNIKKAIIELRENNEIIEEVYDIYPNQPFVIKINNLGLIDNVERVIKGYYFYDSYGQIVDELINNN